MGVRFEDRGNKSFDMCDFCDVEALVYDHNGAGSIDTGFKDVRVDGMREGFGFSLCPKCSDEHVRYVRGRFSDRAKLDRA